ncbi:MAG: hypothetical protein QS748_13110 [Candidatus Endonucleobacter bathymodioli]|uniref:Uncharacterized protein n=1 Tax=Candidatus Endonucleibacter bathymodioli TaxID=539814 RepID=A0AA90NNG8_9GAMM|nr:hypothetical protein [Candidatus Endonucleobacter bathymodioli]
MFLSNISCRLKTNIAALSLLSASVFVQASHDHEFVDAFEEHKKVNDIQCQTVLQVPEDEVYKFFNNLDENSSLIQSLFNEVRHASDLATALCVTLIRIGLTGSEPAKRYFDPIAADGNNANYDKYYAVGMKYRQNFLTFDAVQLIARILDQPVKATLSHLSDQDSVSVEGYQFSEVVTSVNGYGSLWAQKLTAPPEYSSLVEVKSSIKMLNPDEMSAIIFNDVFVDALVDLMFSYIKGDSAIFSRITDTEVTPEEKALAIDSSGKFSKPVLVERLNEYLRTLGDMHMFEREKDKAEASKKFVVKPGDTRPPALTPVVLAAIAHIFPNVADKGRLSETAKNLKGMIRLAMQTLVAACFSKDQKDFNSNFYGYNQCLTEMTGARYFSPVKDCSSRALFTIKQHDAEEQIRAVINQAIQNLMNFKDTYGIIRPMMSFGLRK